MRSIRSMLFACGQPIFPAGWGGAETTVHDLLLALAKQGIQIRALGATPVGDTSRVRQRLETYFASDFRGERGANSFDVGYPAEIVPHEEFCARLEAGLDQAMPDIVLTQAIAWPEVVGAARQRGVPSMLYVHGAEVLKIAVPEQGPDKVLYNSAFTRQWLAGRFPFDGDIFHPPTDLERHRVTGTGPRGAVTLINPLPAKGGHLLPLLARALPHRQFLAVEGWVLPPFLMKLLTREPNIEVVAWQHDMRSVYARTAVLIMPTEFESFGRTPVEAAASGIPCVSSGVGGLRESIGPGGIFVGLDQGIEAWVDAVRELENEEVYKAHAEQQWAWVARFDVQRAALRFLEIAGSLALEHGR